MTILTLGPLLGSLITEPAAMTICALLLVRKFYQLEPSPKLKYATLGLLFVNISVGGTLTHFAAPPVLMVAAPWGWGTGHMLLHFGWKAAVGIVISNLLYWVLFRKEFDALRDKFAVRTLKEEILTTHMPREIGERAVDEFAAKVDGGKGRRRPGDRRAGRWVRGRDQATPVGAGARRIAELGVDPELAGQAFEQRFEEIKLYRLQKRVPAPAPPRSSERPSRTRGGTSGKTRCRPGSCWSMWRSWAGRSSTRTIQRCSLPDCCSSSASPR